jgi:hypothetical protein
MGRGVFAGSRPLTNTRRRPVRQAGFVLASIFSSLAAMAIVGGAESPLETAASLRAAGRMDDALEILRVESRRIKAVEGDASLLLLPINDLASEILVDTGATDTARPLLDKTIATRRSLLDGGRREHAAALGGSLLTLARLETAAKRLPDAADTARLALLAYDRAIPPSPEGVVRAREALHGITETIDELLGPAADATRQARDQAAAAFASLGLCEDAIKQRKRVLEALLSTDTAAPDDLREASESLGRLMLAAGHAGEATAFVGRSLESAVMTQPEQRLPLRRLLGELQLAAGQLAAAEESFTRLIDEAPAAEKPSAVAESGDKLRRLLVTLHRGTAERLPDWFGPTTQGLVRSPPGDVPTAIPAIVVAAQVQSWLGQPAAAAVLLGQALTFASSCKPPDAGLVAEISGRLAAARLAAGDVAATRTLCKGALPTAERVLGPGDARTTFLRIMLADALLRDGAAEQAAALAGVALERELPRPDTDREELVIGIFDRLAAVEGQSDLRERFLESRRAQFGDSHPHAAAACGCFGAARLAAGDWAAAVDFLTRAVDMQRSGAGHEDADLAASLVLLAHAERAAGASDQAVDTAARGLAAWEKVAGPDHPGTLSAAEVLVAAQCQAGVTDGVVAILERLCAADSLTDPVRRAKHLVHLADMIVAGNKPRAKELLRQAMQLPCWQPDAAPGPRDGQQLALTAALAAHAFRVVGDPAAATDALQRARQLALQAENPKPLLDRIETLAADGRLPPAT